MQDMQR